MESARCKRNDGANWRCGEKAARGKSYCEKHILQMENRKRKLAAASAAKATAKLRKVTKMAAREGPDSDASDSGSEKKKDKKAKTASVASVLGKSEANSPKSVSEKVAPRRLMRKRANVVEEKSSEKVCFFILNWIEKNRLKLRKYLYDF